MRAIKISILNIVFFGYDALCEISPKRRPCEFYIESSFNTSSLRLHLLLHLS